MKKYFYLATALVALAACSNEEYVGDNSPTLGEGNGAIQFSYSIPNATRGANDLYGDAAATKLGSYFYVVGTKADMEASPAIPTANPTTQLVFDNYSVKYTANTAGKTESNTANWEYVGVGADANHVKLSPNAQTVKYWDYSVSQYDFHAFSTGTKHAVSGTPANTNEIGVTKSLYGAGLAGGATAYTFDVPNGECLNNIYITDITPVSKANFGKDVQLKFKNLGAKIRIALYETVPGYSIQGSSVKFYADATTPTKPGETGYVAPTTTGTLISTATKGLPLKGTIKVSFPSVGTSNSEKANYNKASVDVTADESAPANYEFTKTFGTISTDEMVVREANETADAVTKLYIGRNLTDASFVGDNNADFYQLAFPVDDSHPLTLRVDYTLISTDGSGEKITVHGAKAVIPSTYTVWQPNFAYTYIFKISDNTNGTTDYATEGLFPITFDAVVADFTDVSGEQKTITTVDIPSITTYQQFHNMSKDEYSKTVKNQKNQDVTKDIYVQVMNDGTLINDLNGTTGESTNKSVLYAVAAGTTEAVVMDALEKRTNATLAETPIVGRNGVTLTPSAKLTNGVSTIDNGVDDNPITVAANTTAKIAKDITAGTYAYVYDYTSGSKTVTPEFQPVAVTLEPTPQAIGDSEKEYYTLLTSVLATSPAATLAVETAVDPTLVYFSKTTTDGVNYTYSYISVANKATVPAGTVTYPKASITSHVPGSTVAAANTFYFDKYFSNNGKYAVKVIKIVD